VAVVLRKERQHLPVPTTKEMKEAPMRAIKGSLDDKGGPSAIEEGSSMLQLTISMDAGTAAHYDSIASDVPTTASSSVFSSSSTTV